MRLPELVRAGVVGVRGTLVLGVRRPRMGGDAEASTSASPEDGSRISGWKFWLALTARVFIRPASTPSSLVPSLQCSKFLLTMMNSSDFGGSGWWRC